MTKFALWLTGMLACILIFAATFAPAQSTPNSVLPEPCSPTFEADCNHWANLTCGRIWPPTDQYSGQGEAEITETDTAMRCELSCPDGWEATITCRKGGTGPVNPPDCGGFDCDDPANWADVCCWPG